MDFSEALARVKTGSKITRKGWNGDGQYVVYQPGYPDGIGINANMAEATGLMQGTVERFRPYLMLHTAQRDFVPWAPSISDVLAGDWEVFFGTGSDCVPAEPEPELPSATVTCNNVTVNVSAPAGYPLTGTQVKELTGQVQASLLEHAKRHPRRGPGAGA